MARTTKLELEQALVASQRDNAALRTELSVLRAQLDAAQRDVALPSVRSDWPTAKVATGRKLPAHFAAAREAAMRLGRSVKVGGAS